MLQSINNSILVNPTAFPSEVHQPYARWMKMSQYIQSFIISHPSISSETTDSLLSFNAQYLVKIAECSQKNVRSDNRDISPLRKTSLRYQRDYTPDNKLLHNSVHVLTQIFPQCSILLISNNGYIKFLKNTRPFLRIRDQDTFESLTRKINKQIPYIEKVFDLTRKIFENEGVSISVLSALPEDLLPTHLKFLYILIDTNECFVYQETRTYVLETMAKVKAVISSLPLKNSDFKVLLLNTLSFTVSYPFVETTKFLATLNGDLYVKAINRGGSTPSVQQSAQVYARTLMGAENFYKEVLAICPTPLSFTNKFDTIQTPQQVVEKLNQLIREDLLFELKKICEEKKINIVETVGFGVLQLIEGLFCLKIEEKFHLLDLSDLLHDSTQRINEYLEQLLSKSDDFKNFGRFFELIMEEVNLLLSIAKPYQMGQLESSIENLISPWPVPDLIRATIGGTQCFTEILNAVLHINKSSGILNILYHDDLYFEFVANIDSIGEGSEKLNTIKKFKVFTENENSFTEHIDHLKDHNEQLHALFIDLHSSCTMGRQIQRSHDIIAILESLQENKLLGDGCICAIDNTIGTWGSEEINSILNRFQKEISEGTIVFTIYRSAHKLDIFGCDKFNGGSYLVYAHPNSPFLKKIQKTTATIRSDSTDYQAYTHIYTHASIPLKRYYEAIVANANFLYAQMNPSLIYPAGKTVWISEKLDSQSVYCEIGFSTAIKVEEVLLRMDENTGLLHNRDSFGYRDTSILRVAIENHPFQVIRITTGIEEKERIAEYANFFNTFLLFLKG